MKILYIAPENTVGTLTLWKKIHEERGNECQMITLYRSSNHLDSDICLDLPMISSQSWYMNLRHKYYQIIRGPLGDYQEKEGYPPTWKTANIIEKLFFKFRDWVWSFKIEPVIEKYNLLNYDIVHLEWGLEFYRDGRFVKRLHENNIPIICTYHGQDLRTRGVIQNIDQYSRLNLTSEVDLLEKHPNINYLFLPYDTSQHDPVYEPGNPIRICHTPTNRYYKGSETIISICERIAEEENVEFILVENRSNSETQKIKNSCDILIDQVHNRGGWGYGMNSVEAMSMGLCCVTELNDAYRSFIPDHPFVDVTGESLYDTLKSLVRNNKLLLQKKKQSRGWVVKHHDQKNVGNALYQYYGDNGYE